MSNSKIYNVIGIMSGTSMDGVDISFIQTNGIDNTSIIYEKKYSYSESYRKKLKKLIKKLPKNKKDKLIYTKNLLSCLVKFKRLNKTRLEILMEKIINFLFMIIINCSKRLNYFLIGMRKNIYLKKSYQSL